MHSQAKCIHHVVLLHGWGTNQAIWQCLRPHLEGLIVHELDLPGFGKAPSSDLPKSATGASVLQSWVKQLIPQLPSKPFSLIGWSMGGLVALALQKARPDQVTNLGLLASSPCFSEKENWQGIPEQELNHFIHALEHDTALTLRNFIRGHMYSRELDMTREQKALFLNALKAVRAHAEPDQRALFHGATLLRDIDLRESFSSTHAECHFLLGEHDHLVPVSSQTQIKSLRPDTHIQIVQNAGHALHLTHHEQCAHWIRKMCGANH